MHQHVRSRIALLSQEMSGKCACLASPSEPTHGSPGTNISVFYLLSLFSHVIPVFLEVPCMQRELLWIRFTTGTLFVGLRACRVQHLCEFVAGVPTRAVPSVRLAIHIHDS